MAQLDIDFEWYRDERGYRLLPAEEPTPLPVNALAALASGKLQWDSVVITGGPSPPTQLRPERVVRLGGELKSYRPLANFPRLLFRIFAKEAVTSKGVLYFIERFGPLTKIGLCEDGGDDVSRIIEQAEFMATILSGYSRWNAITLSRLMLGKGINLGQINAELKFDQGTESLRFKLSVSDLLTALWMQLGQSLSGGATFRTCSHCDMLFEVGAGTGRRLDAKFCSDEHRIVFNSLKRSRVGTANA